MAKRIYIVACGLKTSGTFKSKRNVDLFVVLSALRLDGVFLFFHYRSFPFTYNGLLPE